MKKILKIGIVGCGAIGSSLAKVISQDFSDHAKLGALYDLEARKAHTLSKKVSKERILAVTNLRKLIARSDLVIECSSAKAAWEISRKVIAAGRSIMIMSVGGIVGHIEALRRSAWKKNVRVYIPSGAIAGIDGVKAASLGNIRKATLTTSKPSLAFSGVSYLSKKKIALDKIKENTVLFSGTATQAVKNFPHNINVAGVLSIAGIGEKRTRVIIRASPTLTRNIHEIEIESDAGCIYVRTENRVHPHNPKTSYLAVLSAVAMLKQILEPLRIGT